MSIPDLSVTPSHVVRSNGAPTRAAGDLDEASQIGKPKATHSFQAETLFVIDCAASILETPVSANWRGPRW